MKLELKQVCDIVLGTVPLTDLSRLDKYPVTKDAYLLGFQHALETARLNIAIAESREIAAGSNEGNL